MVAQNSGRHSKRGNFSNSENNDERPPTRINSQHNFVCVDDDIVECIAACVLMHVRQSTGDGYVPPPEYACFTKDVPNINYEMVTPPLSLPPRLLIAVQDCSMENLQYVIRVIHNETRMEDECMIIALIYLERMCLFTEYKYRICRENWRYSVFATMMLASKTWDDYALSNYQYSNIFSNLDLKRINQLEIELLLMLNFTIGVSSAEFHDYHNSIHQLITAVNFRRVQNKLEKHALEASAITSTSSSLSLSSPVRSGRDVPGLVFKKIPSDRYEMSRVGGMCVLLEKDFSCNSSNEDYDRDKTLSRRSRDEEKGNQSPSASQKQRSVFQKGSVFQSLNFKNSKRVLPSLGGGEPRTESTHPDLSAAPRAMPHPSQAPTRTLQPLAVSATAHLNKPKVATQLSLAEFEEISTSDQQRRMSVLESFSSTLSEVRSFFSQVFHSSDRVYVEEDPAVDKILPTRTSAQSEFSLSHRNHSGKSFSSRTSSWRTMRSQHPSGALPSLKSS
jgi:hypothetical protein